MGIKTYRTGPVEKPAMPCPGVIAELDAIMQALTPEFVERVPETNGWFSTLWDAKRAILARYYEQFEAYNIQEEFKAARKAAKKAGLPLPTRRDGVWDLYLAFNRKVQP